MLRNRAVALILCCTVSTLVFALGLGPLQSTSTLNEPFTGQIEIIGATVEDFDALTLKLASPEQFARAGIDLNPVLYSLRFALDDGQPGKSRISVTSRDPIREPYLNFLLEMNWANGRLLREYTVLLDPPLYVAKPSPGALTEPLAPAPDTAISAPSVADISDGAGARASAGESVQRGAYVGGAEIGPVVASDTLWSLASAHRPDGSVTIQQTMLAFLRANPEAFGEGNVNYLRRGAVLRMPERSAITNISAQEAFAEVKRQHQLWEEYRQRIAGAPSPQPVGAAAVGATAAVTEAPQASARLELVAPGAAESGSAPGSAPEGDGSELLREELEAHSQQNANLKSKLDEAEEIIGLLQRQVNIKDEELAALQARLLELGMDEEEIRERVGAVVAAATPEEAPAIADAETLGETDDFADEQPADADAAVVEGAAPEPLLDEEISAPDMEEPESPVDSAPAAQRAAPAPAPERSFPANLIPEHIAAQVPGGSLTVLGGIAALVLGLFVAIVLVLLKARTGKAQAATSVTTTRARSEETRPPVTETPMDDSEAPTEFAADQHAETRPTADSDTASQPAAAAAADVTEAPVQEPEVDEEGVDPLEEINVYLAYERFDQAEQLVKEVIEQNPERHEYKLRLLEVYYSANDRAAYEEAARSLLEAVGQDDPLWPSALAMWAEMSPDRELFAEGPAGETPVPQEETKAFVDVTGDGQDGQSGGGLDFDLGAAEEDADDAVFDLTAAAENDDILDITATGAHADAEFETTSPRREPGPASTDDILELPSGTGSAADEEALELEPEGAVLDASSADEPGDDDIFDITRGLDTDLDLNINDDAPESADILDITATENAAETAEADDGSDIFDISAAAGASELPGSSTDADGASPAGGELLDSDTAGVSLQLESEMGAEGAEVSGAQDDGLDFDITGSIADVFEPEDHSAVLDLEASAGSDGLDEFDIDDLDVDVDGTAAADGDAADLPAATEAETELSDVPAIDEAVDMDIDLDITMDGDDDGVSIVENEDADGSLEITMQSMEDAPTEGEVSLQGDDLDELAMDADDGGEIDISLDGTMELESLADTRTTEEGNLEIDLSDLSLDDDGPVSELAEASGEGELDLSDTLAMDAPDLELEFDHEQTIAMPASGNVETQSDADEADTKLNLAKAYIELGDADGARSILKEVLLQGDDGQRAEADSLLADL